MQPFKTTFLQNFFVLYDSLISVSMFVSLVDLCTKNEAFSSSQKQLLSSWQTKMRSLWHPLPIRRYLPSQEPARRGVSRSTPQCPPHPALARRYSLQNRYHYHQHSLARGVPIIGRGPPLTRPLFVTPPPPQSIDTSSSLQRRSVPELKVSSNFLDKRDNYLQNNSSTMVSYSCSSPYVLMHPVVPGGSKE